MSDVRQQIAEALLVPYHKHGSAEVLLHDVVKWSETLPARIERALRATARLSSPSDELIRLRLEAGIAALKGDQDD